MVNLLFSKKSDIWTLGNLFLDYSNIPNVERIFCLSILFVFSLIIAGTANSYGQAESNFNGIRLITPYLQGPLVVGNSIYTDSSDEVHLVGDVKNNFDFPIESVSIVGSVYEPSGQFLLVLPPKFK